MTLLGKIRRRLSLISWARVAFLILCGLSMGSPQRELRADDNVWFVRKLNDTRPWDRFVDSPIAIRVEGRIGSSGGGQFRLLRCEARFSIDPNKLKVVPAKSTVEVKGRFKKQGQRIDFVVDEIKVLSSYVSQYDLRASKLLRPTPQDWLELGDWVLERARFYEDDELATKAKDAYLNAIEVEYKSLKASDFEGRLLLAKKINEQNLSKRRALELIHEGLQIQWQTLLKNEPESPVSWQQFANTLSDQLQGTKTPLKTVTADLKENYEQDPLSIYREADDDLRIKLNRLFFVIVTRKILLQNESSDGRDGDLIADQIDKQIPEEHGLAEKKRELRLANRLENVRKVTRSEIENLASTLRKRNRYDDAIRALREWIKSHEASLKEDGVIGRLQLADEYLGLLNDENSAVENLKEAYTIEPGYEAVKSKLTSLGYHWDGVRWSKIDSMTKTETNPDFHAPTEITPGMTATGLRTLLGQPRSLLRAITSRGITEIWSFGPKGGSQLIIRLEQKGRDLEPKVSSFSGQ